jgi:hypothetical protein
VILNLGKVITGADHFGGNPFSGARLGKRASRTTENLNKSRYEPREPRLLGQLHRQIKSECHKHTFRGFARVEFELGSSTEIWFACGKVQDKTDAGTQKHEDSLFTSWCEKILW